MVRQLRGSLQAMVIGAALSGSASGAQWEAPDINEKNLNEWLQFIRPSGEELSWQKIRWHGELEDAAAEARKLQRPILLWTMNGHPCGET